MKKLFCLALCMMNLLGCIGSAEEGNSMFENGQDITSAIQQAVNEAQKGDIILIPAGVYYVSKQIELPGDITIRGESMEETVLVAAMPFNALFWLSNRENVTISHMTIDGKGLMVGNIVDAQNCSNILIDSLHIQDLESDANPIAIHFSRTADSAITNCVFDNISLKSDWGCAIRLSYSSRNLVDGNVIRNTGRGGILCDNRSEYLTITNNQISGSGISSEGLSIELWGRCGYSIVEDNVVDQWLSLDKSPYTALRRNVVSNKNWDRIGFIGIETVGSCNVVVTDCLVDEGVYIGLSESNAAAKEYLYWGNVTVRGCAQWGAQFQGEKGGCRYQYFYNLNVEDTYRDRKPIYPGDAGHALRFNDACEYFVFEDCAVKNNRGNDIQTLGKVDHLLFVNYTAENNQQTNHNAARKYGSEEFRYVCSFECPETVKVGEAVQFVSHAEDAAHYLWDFGQGIPSTEEQPAFTYTKPGVYTVTLIAWNAQGDGARYARTIEVTE